MNPVQLLLNFLRQTPAQWLLLMAGLLFVGALSSLYLILFMVAPLPRSSLPSEKTCTYVSEDGATRKHQPLPCWFDSYMAEKEAARAAGKSNVSPQVEPAEVYISLVVPAYNEEERLGIMLTEATAYLEQRFGPGSRTQAVKSSSKDVSKHGKRKSGGGGGGSGRSPSPNAKNAAPTGGYEIIIVSDGSTDRTVETALSFARKQMSDESRPNLRVVSLEHNRGKGGAVTHGLRHVRGSYALFADADGATRFSDLGAVLEAARVIELETAGGAQKKGGSARGDGAGQAPGTLPAVSVGSRAHMVNTPAVVKRSALRNLLMRGFHVFLKLMTPPRTARIGDTQCGFKLFSRGALPAIVPWMHMEGWIFDVEMLMLAEIGGIDVAEVPVGWKEIGGSKLNVIWDSLGMAWGLAVLRGAWTAGIYKRW